MFCHLYIICYLKGNSKYKKSRVNKQTDIKVGWLLLKELEAEMAKAKKFEQLLLTQILLNKLLLISSAISFLSKESVTSNYLFNQTNLIAL